ncbi:lysM domain protein [Chlamydia pneumoniae LPCoLN]|uniref:LysM peptidoglycan-binding domain-containing protein n=1 Tax=Chlamydia pneumoniae TaxID=83558 RepID=UPI0001BD9D0E|nr:LysM peptidoglycan-binding domain-containing protein [Chlamydia pneumoniae]ACZ32669.1 lysM domain protein [Chlamydia pneumoniae LPCoLN]ETR79523.1 N-Acetylmuramoyl-L-Ala Amidase [Chlamydia pneumoniae B21]
MHAKLSFFILLSLLFSGIDCCRLHAAGRSPSLQGVLAEIEDISAKLASHEVEIVMLSERLDEQDSKCQKWTAAKPETLAQKIRELESDQKALAKTLAVLTTSVKDLQTNLQSKLQEIQKDHRALAQDLRLVRRSLLALVDSSSPGAYADFSDPVPENIYIVREGDSLSKIAKKYKLSVTELKKINKLDSDAIYAGQRLCLQRNKQ